MLKELRLWWSVLALTVVSFSGCGHKPAYSDIDANRSSNTANQNSDGRAGTTPAPPTADLPPLPGSQPPGSPPASAAFKTPSFLDQSTGAIRDLPNYPRSTRASIQIGPNQGLNVVTLVLQTDDSMDLIAAFYQKLIKENQWTVANKIVDPDLAEWILTKGEEQTARIQVKKDQVTSKRNIFIVRGEKLPETNK